MSSGESCCSWRCGLLRQAAATWREGMERFKDGDAAKAEAMQRKALSVFFGLGGFPVVRARIHNNLGVILCCTGRAEEAVREFAQALALVKGRIDPASRFQQALQNNHGEAAAQARKSAQSMAA